MTFIENDENERFLNNADGIGLIIGFFVFIVFDLLLDEKYRDILL